MRSIPRIVTVLGALWLAPVPDAPAARAEDAAADRAAIEFFESKVRPLLVDQCIACHGPEKQKAGLRLDTADGMRQGGDSGPVVMAGDPDQSPLIEAVRYNGEPRMPPRGKLADDQIAVLADWVKRGARWPEPARAEGTDPAADPAAPVAAKGGDLWSLRPIVEPPLPAVSDAGWARTPVDRFILAGLDAAGLAPAPEADRRTLIRRLSFDLTGLPPAPEAVEAFVTDSAPEAYERLVDRLLASPAYGERWGRHWLDLARYGEDQAHSFQPRLYPSGFRYRDWVIAAFNGDLPYDRFLTEQLAGDLLDEPGRAERLPALGFAACGPVYYGDAKGFDQIDDRIDTLARGVLGLTVACARCHDHKYDPISQADYYALAGVYRSTEYVEEPLVPREVVEAYEKGQAELKAAESAIDAFLAAETLERARSQARAIAPHVLAAWKWQRRRLADPAVTLERIAREEGLEPRDLTRWSEHLAKAEPDLPHRRAWRRLEARTWSAPAADLDALQAEVVAFAEGLEARALDLIGGRLAAQAAGRKAPGGDKAAELLANELVGDQGLYRIPKDKAEERLAADARERLKALRAERDRVQAAIPPKYPIAHALKDGKPANVTLLHRGNPASAGPEVPRRFLAVLGGAPFDAGSGRLQLARAVTAPENPLTDRVLVNRVWQHHFGRGLVATPSNFGTLGDRPSHPELLDDLATRFRDSGRSLKALHRLILLSATYRQSSTPASGTAESDPENRLLGRMNRQRLEVEPWRDALLSVSGQLRGQIGGPSQSLDDPANVRRTVYATISRHDLAPLLRLFDFPEPNITSGERTRTTVPLQQLFVLNDELMARTARALVNRLASVAGDDPAARIDAAYRILFGRPPTDAERRVGLAYLAAPEPEVPEGGLKLSRWERYAQVLLGTNEFAYLD